MLTEQCLCSIARSPVFKAELPDITLYDITPATFRSMLGSMYTDALPGDEELGDSLSEIAASTC